ncbi:MAG TPA: endonuclease NucS [Anaerolineae bacterium]|nr:endonuclease NucS [Anaerolineae bacterium]
MPLVSTTDPIITFIELMHEALQADTTKGVTPPIERRKLRTIITDCGQKRGSQQFLARLASRLAEAGIYSEPAIADSGLRADDWVLFSSGPFPPDSAFFPRETDLQRFVEACLGSGVFRNLEPYRGDGRKSGREYLLPDGRRIDLLCQERTRSGVGALVVIELKREHERGTIEQVMSYIDTLKKLHPSRTVRGIIVSGRESQVASTLLKTATGYDIKWFCYRVTFEQLTAS